jgi:hypothetical protein
MAVVTLRLQRTLWTRSKTILDLATAHRSFVHLRYQITQNHIALHFTSWNSRVYTAPSGRKVHERSKGRCNTLMAKKKKRKQATSNNISNSVGNFARVDDDAGRRRLIKVDNDDEDDVKEVVVASERSFKKRRRVGEDGSWISLPPEGQEAQEVEVEDEKPIVVNHRR